MNSRTITTLASLLIVGGTLATQAGGVKNKSDEFSRRLRAPSGGTSKSERLSERTLRCHPLAGTAIVPPEAGRSKWVAAPELVKVRKGSHS